MTTSPSLTIEYRSVDDVTPDPGNVRLHPERNLEAIKASLRRFGFQKPIVVDSKGVVRAGNGTLEAAKALGIESVPVVVTDLSGPDAVAYAIADNRTGDLAIWDTEALAAQLAAFPSTEREALGFCAGDLESLGEAIVSLRDGAEENPYTLKIESPTYEPTGDKPPISSLANDTRSRELLNQIEATPDLPSDVRAFLSLAAYRHVEFHYQNIAEWYCHASPAEQRLAEESALVIIDFNKAIELGYVRVCERMRALAGDLILNGSDAASSDED